MGSEREQKRVLNSQRLFHPLSKAVSFTTVTNGLSLNYVMDIQGNLATSALIPSDPSLLNLYVSLKIQIMSYGLHSH